MNTLDIAQTANTAATHPLLESNGRLGVRKLKSSLFGVACLLVTLAIVSILSYLLYSTFASGSQWLTKDFFINFASRIPENCGIKAALYGTGWLLLVTTFTAVPIGVATGIYLEELMTRGRLHRFISYNITNLAGVPSVVYGIFGLSVFVRLLGFERSVLSGGLTLALMSLPVIIISTREAIAAVPSSIRLGALAMGATRWQTARDHIFPTALPGIMTGVILAISRAIGETAPLIILGAVSFAAFVPANLMDGYTALPMQIYTWISKPKEEFQQLAAAAIMVLLAMLLVSNSVAIYIRIRSRKVKL